MTRYLFGLTLYGILLCCSLPFFLIVLGTLRALVNTL